MDTLSVTTIERFLLLERVVYWYSFSCHWTCQHASPALASEHTIRASSKQLHRKRTPEHIFDVVFLLAACGFVCVCARAFVLAYVCDYVCACARARAYVHVYTCACACAFARACDTQQAGERQTQQQESKKEESAGA